MGPAHRNRPASRIWPHYGAMSTLARCGWPDTFPALGATHLVMDAPQRQDRTHGPWDSGDKGCNNCVSQAGQAYRCGGKSEDPGREQREEEASRAVMEGR
jgi:hypothetical protein